MRGDDVMSLFKNAGGGAEMTKAVFPKMVRVLVFLWGVALCGSNAFGSVQGQTACETGTNYTLWQNLTGAPVNFDLTVSLVPQGGSATCILSWTDAKGHAQTITLSSVLSIGVSTSLPTGGTVTVTAISGYALVPWQFERAK